MTTTTIAPDGRLTIPEPARAALGLPHGGELDVVAVGGVVVLRPVDRLTPEEEAAVARSRADYAAGRFRADMTVEELERLIDAAG